MSTPSQFCPSCGKEGPQGAGFCSLCGAILSRSQPWTQPQYQQVQPPPHSRLGIASLVLSIVGAVIYFGALAIAVFLGAYGRWELGETGEVLGGLAVLVGVAALLAALGLGIAGIVQKRRKSLFAILGTVFSAVALVAIASMVALAALFE
jgi:hypothetical protein